MTVQIKTPRTLGKWVTGRVRSVGGTTAVVSGIKGIPSVGGERGPNTLVVDINSREWRAR